MKNKYIFICILVGLAMCKIPVQAQEKMGFIKKEDFTIEIFLDNEWENNYQATIKIHNTSDETIRNWLLEFESGDRISKIWNAEIKNVKDNYYYVGGTSKLDIQPNETITFSYIASYDDMKLFFSDGYIYSEDVIISDSVYKIESTIDSQWDDEKIIELTIHNQSDEDFVDWSLCLENSCDIVNVWGANLKYSNSDILLVYTEGINKIKAHEKYVVKLKIKSSEMIEPQGINLYAVNWGIKDKLEDDEDDICNQIENIELTEKQYGNLRKAFSDEEIENMTSDMIELYKNDNSLQVVDEKTIYVKTDYVKVLGEEIPISEEEITQKEAELESKKNNKLRASSSSHSTKVKSLTLKVTVGTITSYKHVTLTNHWYSLPKVRTFDVIALRPATTSYTINTITDSNVSGYQKYNGSKEPIFYSHSSKNFKNVKNGKDQQCGIGLSMNLKDDATMMDNCLQAVFVCKGKFSVWGTYQHATSNKIDTLGKSQKYKFKPYGYGNVLDFDSSVKGHYDQMKGVVVTSDY